MRNQTKVSKQQRKPAKKATVAPRTERIANRFSTSEMALLKRQSKKAGYQNLREFIISRCSN